MHPSELLMELTCLFDLLIARAGSLESQGMLQVHIPCEIKFVEELVA
jgi:hypothetical protein